jgi:hypothetical protein
LLTICLHPKVISIKFKKSTFPFNRLILKSPKIVYQHFKTIKNAQKETNNTTRPPHGLALYLRNDCVCETTSSFSNSDVEMDNISEHIHCYMHRFPAVKLLLVDQLFLPSPVYGTSRKVGHRDISYYDTF